MRFLGIDLEGPSGVLPLAVIAAISGCAAMSGRTNPADDRIIAETLRVKSSAGSAKVDMYGPKSTVSAPLVIVAHGFWRHRHNMSGWGRHLAKEGFVVAVPDLPAWSDHARNGRFLSELRRHLCAGEAWKGRIDPARVGLMGFSAGGLATLLSAADSQGIAIWVGLDPVDRKGLGAKAAPLLDSRAVVLTAEPSACNAHGSAREILAGLPRSEHFHIAGAVHVDAEWPTDWMAQAACGRSTEEKRSAFRRLATDALRDALSPSAISARPAPERVSSHHHPAAPVLSFRRDTPLSGTFLPVPRAARALSYN